MRTCIALRAWRNNVPLEFEIARYPTSVQRGEDIYAWRREEGDGIP